VVVVLGGPNGAGKSTCAPAILPAGITFVNADDVARTLSGYPSPAVDRKAGRLVLRRLDELARNRMDLAIETTLAGRTLAGQLSKLRDTGYFLRLIYLWSASADFSVARVAARVRSGGHGIPEATIRRRYHAGLLNLFGLYLPLADAWDVHDNTGSTGPRLVAEKQASGPEVVHDPELWDRILKEGRHARRQGP
jgi:predicted ABC-type ATPase